MKTDMRDILHQYLSLVPGLIPGLSQLSSRAVILGIMPLFPFHGQHRHVLLHCSNGIMFLVSVTEPRSQQQ